MSAPVGVLDDLAHVDAAPTSAPVPHPFPFDPTNVPESLRWAHPIVQEWFVSKFGTPTEPQEAGWPQILANVPTLISAPTGSGKTLAAFLACIDRLVRKALAGDLHDRIEVLYVSPLKALGNDIQKNLEAPLSEIQALAGSRGLLMPTIRAVVRTGDTLTKDRALMLRKPPHILVTTPESLYILLTAEKSRRILRDIETVIVDEIHAVADDKRGTHLMLSLERLDQMTERRPVRIGLSATQKPIELIAEFLAPQNAEEGGIHIVNVGHRRKLDIAVEIPSTELGPVASNEMWGEIYDRLAELALQHRSTLVFVNTRRMAERLGMHLAERLGEDKVATHHGSLARKLRLQAERKLKNGEVRLLVATASLELGIDVGTVDLVCQIGSPRSIAVALQRVGRAGHWRGAIPKGRIFATTRDELVECAALVQAIGQLDLDRIIIPDKPLDILAQQIVASCAAEEWDEDALFEMVRRAYPYRNLTRKEFDDVLQMLSEGIAARRSRYGAYLYRDQVNKRLRARRGARLAAITSGGAIPETALFTVVAMPEGTVVGTLDEDFAVESNAGDIMLLGNTSWRIRRVEGRTGKVIVEDAHGAPPSVPFWRGEAPSRTEELSWHVAEVRRRVSELTPHVAPVHHEERRNDDGEISSTRLRGIEMSPEVQEATAFLKAECGLDDAGALQVVEYIVAGRAVLGDVPTQSTIIAERFFDEAGGMQLIIHAPFGGRINKAWGLALRKRFCRSFNFELQAAATDDGLNIALAEQHSFPLADVFSFLQPETVQDVLQQAVLTGSPIFATRWRWDANRSLALLRFMGGKKVPPQIQRMRSDDLLASVFPDVAACQENIVGEIKVPDHPLVTEVMKDVLHEAMDIDGLRKVLEQIRSGEVKILAVDTPVPSQFCHEILNANPYAYLDDAPLEERRARAVQMRRTLPESILQEVGGLDPAAIEQVQDEATPDLRDSDELHDTLQTLILLSPDVSRSAPDAPIARWSRLLSEWHMLMVNLVSHRRAVQAFVTTEDGEREYWVPSEKIHAFRAIFPEARFAQEAPELPTEPISRADAILASVTGWMMHTGPATASEIAATLGIEEKEINQAFLRLEGTGAILRGNYRTSRSVSQAAVVVEGAEVLARDTGKVLEWCDRRLLARIHRLTLGALRKQIEPVMPAQFMRWLLRWQHIAPGTQLTGDRGTLEAIRQLQGFEIPANAWERQILTRRLREYDSKTLDDLCLTGAVGWGRLSPHPATVDENGGRTRRVVPTSVAPITLFLRDEAEWMAPREHGEDEEQEKGLSPVAREVIEFLRRRGASFFPDVVRGTGKLKAEVETGLWELVAAGFVTADGFDNLRSLIDLKRRAGQGHAKASRPRNAAGRWSLLYLEPGDHQRRIEATCWMLLKRYGIVFRELLARESNLPKWRELQVAYRRLEDRGEIRGGRFVSGFIGEQFALPVAVESVREMKRVEPSGETITISAADPLNLVGIVVPGERVPAISGRTVTFRDGVAYDAQEEHPFVMPEAAAG